MKGTILALLCLAWQYSMANEMVTTTTVEAVGGDVITATTIEGDYIEEARISRIYPDGISIVTSDGVRRLKWYMLPPEIKARYAAAAAAAEQEEIERLRARISVLEDHLRTDRTAYISPSRLPPAAHDPATLYYHK